MKRWFRGALVVIGVQALLFAAYWLNKNDRQTVVFRPLDEPSPAMIYETADGVKHTLRGVRGRPVILHFWATWCPPCRNELPALIDYAEQSEFEVLAVSVDPDWARIKAFLANKPTRAIVRTSTSAASDFDVETLPVTFVVSADGRLRARFDGAQDWRSNELVRAIAERAQ